MKTTIIQVILDMKIILLVLSFLFNYSAFALNDYNAHDFTFKTYTGSDIKLSEYKNNLIMIVNVSSSCGFTKQYNEIEKLWYKYKDKGLIVLAVPSSDFITSKKSSVNDQKMCRAKNNISFPIVKEYSVIGDRAHPFFKWVASEAGNMSIPKGNFYKYLISKDGQIIDWYATDTPAISNQVLNTIEENI